MKISGAQVVTTNDNIERWHYMRERVKRDGFFPITNYLFPPVGSNSFGNEGYRTIAFEIYEQLHNSEPDVIIAPTDRADLLWGLYAGFQDMRQAGFARRIPRLYAVEPFARISAVLAGADYRGSFKGVTKLFSIAGTTVAYQGVAAVKQSNGGAVVVRDSEVIQDQALLARQGIYLELSGAAALTGLRSLCNSGAVGPEETVVLIGTSSGMIDNFDPARPEI
jgi:threonine synthase